MTLEDRVWGRRAAALVTGFLLAGGCSLAPWGDDDAEELPAWAGKAPRQVEVERGVGLMTSQKSLEPEDAARLDQLSDPESIQKNVAVERVEGVDPCVGVEAASAQCAREFGGRRSGRPSAVLPEVRLQMIAPESGQAFDPARAVDGIGRGDERRTQELLAVGDSYLNPSEKPEKETLPEHENVPEGILVDPSVIGSIPQ